MWKEKGNFRKEANGALANNMQKKKPLLKIVFKLGFRSIDLIRSTSNSKRLYLNYIAKVFKKHKKTVNQNKLQNLQFELNINFFRTECWIKFCFPWPRANINTDPDDVSC